MKNKLKEFSSGAVIFRWEGERLLFLLIYSRRSLRWGFPKGHIEDGEDEIKAACREIAEETGLVDLHFIEGFRFEDVYPAISRREPNKGKEIEKHSIYYLCRVDSSKVSVDTHEISDYRWLEADDAGSLLPKGTARLILGRALDVIRAKG